MTQPVSVWLKYIACLISPHILLVIDVRCFEVKYELLIIKVIINCAPKFNSQVSKIGRYIYQYMKKECFQENKQTNKQKQKTINFLEHSLGTLFHLREYVFHYFFHSY